MERRVLVSQYRLSIYITPVQFRYASLLMRNMLSVNAENIQFKQKTVKLL